MDKKTAFANLAWLAAEYQRLCVKEPDAVVCIQPVAFDTAAMVGSSRVDSCSPYAGLLLRTVQHDALPGAHF